MRMSAVRPRLLALGDSIACGEGVGTLVPPGDTWVGVLANALDAELNLLARRGFRTREVRSVQLPLAVSQPALLATVVTGLNDVVNGQFDSTAVREELLYIVSSLRAADTPVLLVRLHDPTLLLPMPSWLRRMARERLAVINGAVDEAVGPGVMLLDLARVPTLWTRGGWTVDRVHPGIAGHRGIAAAACDVLADNGFDIPNPVQVPLRESGHSRIAEVRWLAKHGAPYLARKAGEQRIRDWLAAS